jgi:hypothetical protein
MIRDDFKLTWTPPQIALAYPFSRWRGDPPISPEAHVGL